MLDIKRTNYVLKTKHLQIKNQKLINTLHFGPWNVIFHSRFIGNV